MIVETMRRLFRKPTDAELRERERRSALEALATTRRIEAAAAMIAARGRDARPT